MTDSNQSSNPPSTQPDYVSLLSEASGLGSNQSTIRFDAESGSRSGIGTVIATTLFITAAAISYLLLIFTSSSSEISDPNTDRAIRISVTITLPLFRNASTAALCSKNSTLGDLTKTPLSVTDSSNTVIARQVLGKGILNGVGGCTYNLIISTPGNFSGGKIRTLINFATIGPVPVDPFDVGTTLPFKSQEITLQPSN
jgi:hypothetical protein